MTIETLFRERLNTPHNIDQHMPALRRLGSLCRHITEFGTDIGFSTTAFLAAKPAVLHSYDINRTYCIDTLEQLAVGVGIDYQFHQEDTLRCPVIDATDLLLVDSDHTAEQVRGELQRHGHRVRRYLVFHDTVSFPAIVPAIQAYTDVGWRLAEWYDHQHGLWVYEREIV